LKHGWLLVLLLALFTAAGYSFYLQWHNPQQLQGVGVIANFAIAGLLALVTWVYARATEKTLDLYREQWEFQQKIHIRFGMSIKDGKPWIRIVNPGGLRFMVTKVVFLVRERAPHTINTYLMVGPGEKRGMFVPLRIYQSEPHNADMNVTVHYEPYGKPEDHISRAFRIELSRGKIIGIRKGVRGLWLITCPKCENQIAAVMKTDGLENFTHALAREDEMKQQLHVTCPDHQSVWMESVEGIRQRSNAEQNMGTEDEG
jgi:hypothetical protein